MKKINLKKKFNLFQEHWAPKTIAELNGQSLKIAKVKGEFVWHEHAREDELFMVIKGQLSIKLESETIVLDEGELFVVPKGNQHKPIADKECWILLFEPISTKHTGDVKSNLTNNKNEWI